MKGKNNVTDIRAQDIVFGEKKTEQEQVCINNCIIKTTKCKIFLSIYAGTSDLVLKYYLALLV